MVLCTYFMNGNCRFGSKCVNDHIDLKTLLKTEVESAVNGKQWLLSCFGPFKESTVLPNFIPDRSFEEVRLSFLEASKTNQQQQHINELISQYNDAMSKLNHLKMATPDTIQLIANIYNQSIQEQKQPPPAPGGNVFAMPNSSAAPAQQSNPFQLNSVFGSTQQPQTTMNAGSIFGSSATSNPFQSSGSIFGGQKEQPAQTSSFTFSLNQQQQQQQPQQSIFGSATPAQPQQSIFGSSVQPQNSIFGSTVSSPGSAFAGNQTFRQTNIFGAGQQQPESSVFGQPSIFSQPQQPSQSIFSSGAQQPQTTFQPQSQSVFGQFQAQQQQQQVAQPVTQPAGLLFNQGIPAAQTQSIFGAPTNQVQPQPQPTSAPSGSIFQIQQPTQATNVQQNFVNPFQQQPPKIDESVYSKPEDLTPEELQAFQADTFEIGNLPLKPPPQHLCF